MKKIIIWLGHPALGALTVVVGLISLVYAVLWVILYLSYEIVESYWVKDRGDIDIRDFYIGFGFGLAILFLLQYYLSWRPL